MRKTIVIIDGVTVSELLPKRYRALIICQAVDGGEEGEKELVVNVLENTLGGEVLWTRNDIGNYQGELEGAFPSAKTICLNGSTGFVCEFWPDGDYDKVLFLQPDHDITDPMAIDISVYP